MNNNLGVGIRTLLGELCCRPTQVLHCPLTLLSEKINAWMCPNMTLKTMSSHLSTSYPLGLEHLVQPCSKK